MITHFLRQNVLLLIRDPNIRESYHQHRRKAVNFLGAFMLIIRLINIMYRVLKYEQMSSCIQTHYFVITGSGIHILAQILSLKFSWASYMLAPVVILSYLNLRFCINEKTKMDHVAVLLDTVAFDVFITMLLSM
jgi:hypothetical protein